MRFDDRDNVETGDIEDRRGGGFPGRAMGAGAGGLGIVGVVIYLAVRLLGGSGPTAVNVERALEGTDRLGNNGAPSPGSMPPLTGSCQGVTSSTDPPKFIACVETNVQTFWRDQFSRSGKPYERATLVLFRARTRSPCGDASSETGPFYCPEDEKVYLDLGFFHELETRFGAHGGDFAQAYVVAHEMGHHIQRLLGVEQKVHAAEEQNPEQRNALSVKLELQADCYAGVWGHAAYDRGKVGPDEVAQALDAASAVGDDRIQKNLRGRVNPETFTHGSSAERQRWFNQGMNSGDPTACNTFASRP